MTQIIAITPFERPDPGLVRALASAGAIAVLDLGRRPAAARAALRALEGQSFAVRVPEGATTPPLPPGVTAVISRDPSAATGLPWWAEVTSVAEARAAVAAGAAIVLARGHEAGGRVGAEGSFILAQRLAAADLPVQWFVHGGIGTHTGAAAIVAGAAGLVVDAQLALVAECGLPVAVQQAIRGMDGSETAIFGGHRLFTRPDLAAPPDDAEAVRARLGADDLRANLIPAGQDAAFAASMAARWPSTRAMIAGLRQEIAAHLDHAASADALGSGARLARQMGTALPIAQGPMTRVSDTPAFARAVADAGALPFVALSMLNEAGSERLLTQTATACAGRAWGVGILGFLPPEQREMQLGIIARVRPPWALIAGGRPSQARALEATGIRTWLHVPSPALLDAFLADGARRFVFEGKECGGHVGPRTSFVLWEQMISRLLASPHVGEVEVLFAGGVHDGRSAAMVAALAGGLCAAGAKIGVLMGTAYLFTEEAVSTGAIVQAFQDEALRSDDTVLLESAPGHATRAAATPFAAAFDAERARLEAAGVPQKEVWARLEALNVGRLRVAAKGLERGPEGVVAVDGERQRAEGLYMLGQVASLRGQITTLAALHHEIAEAGARLAPWRVHPAPKAAPPPCRIAIVGMAAMLPDADDVDAYWANIQAGHDAVREVPADRWRADLYFSADGEPGEFTPSKWGGFLSPQRFDPMRYGLPPRSLIAIDPVQLLSLDVARRALDDAGYGARPFHRERTSVIFGTESGSDLGGAYAYRAHHRQWSGPLPEALDQALPKLTNDSFPGVLGNVVSGRIANRLGLGGANYTVDAACASSLAAVDLAVKELTNGTSDLVICGGADTHNSINDYLLFASVHALSPTGRCRTFDAAADGIALGEGVAAIVLKRLEDAERDGDRIYAVIQGVGASSDGRALGLTAPLKEGQTRAVRRAWAQARLDPRHVGVVEAHGTGTVVGDRTELQTLEEAFAGAANPVTLGSVKSQIGHTKCAAGLAGLIKTALAIHHGVRPPTIGVRQPNPAWDAARTVFEFSAIPRPWADARRIAGVSAFGFGGTNFHVVLENAATHAPRPRVRPAELFVVRGSAAQADTTMRRLADLASGGAALPALAKAALGEGPVVLAFVARSPAEVASLCAAGLARKAVPGALWLAGPAPSGPVAFLFPGQGSQRPHALRELFLAEPSLQRLLTLAPDVTALLYPPDAWDDAGRRAQQDALTDTRAAQPALGITSLAVADWLSSCGVEAAMAGGHSYGELAALCWAGALASPDLVALSRARAESILGATDGDAGAMAAVPLAPSELSSTLADHPGVVLANHNAPRQSVLAGPTPAIVALCAALDKAGVAARRLTVACAFHSPVVARAEETFTTSLTGVDFAPRAVPVWSNVTAAPYPSAESPAILLARQLTSPVRFVEQIEAMYAAGARTFVEVGPGRVLSGLVGRILGEKPHLAIPTDVPGEPGWVTLLGALAQLAVAGARVDERALLDGREIAEPTPPTPDTHLWLVDGHRARPLHGAPPPGGLTLIHEPLGFAPAAPVAPSDSREEVVSQFLDNMAAIAAAQRDAVLAMLGASPSIPAPAAIRHEAPPPILDDAATHSGPPIAAPEAARPADLGALVTSIVADRTGYPVDMLSPDLDLEADLSIDSIKRIEILTTLGAALGDGGGLDDAAIEHLATRRTLRELVAALTERLGGGDPKVARYRLIDVDSPLPDPARPLPTTWRVLGDPARVAALTEALTATGVTLSEGDVSADCTVIIGVEAPAAAGWLAHDTAGVILGVCAPGDDASGLPGLFRSLARELPDRAVRLLRFGAPADAADLAAHLHAEAAVDGPAVVTVTPARTAELLVEAPLTQDATDLPIHDGDAVLVTGGARGITARVALALAARVKARFVLVGRSPAPGDEPPELASCLSAADLRKALIQAGGGRPAEIEARVKEILAAREIRETLTAIAATGATATYAALDVRDVDALRALVDDLSREGRIGAVIHGAGIIEDRLLKDKPDGAFDRVWRTKVDPAEALAAALPDDVGAVVLFGSISGAFGNRGQTDYAAANDALSAIGARLAARITGRVVTVDWGPWKGAGMVNDALAAMYAQKGVALIDADEGAEALIAELTRGDRADHRVQWFAGPPAALGAPVAG